MVVMMVVMLAVVMVPGMASMTAEKMALLMVDVMVLL